MAWQFKSLNKKDWKYDVMASLWTLSFGRRLWISYPPETQLFCCSSSFRENWFENLSDYNLFLFKNRFEVYKQQIFSSEKIANLIHAPGSITGVGGVRRKQTNNLAKSMLKGWSAGMIHFAERRLFLLLIPQVYYL